MTPQLKWLPELVLFRDHDSDWDEYLAAIYEYFRQDFVDSKPTYEGRRLSLKRHPVRDGKEATFWHVVSSGANEAKRKLDERRCERIRWPRPIIDHHSDPEVKIWENKRRGETRICLWLESDDFLVVLAERKRYLLFWTAYPVVQPHRKRKLQNEFEAYWRGIT